MRRISAADLFCGAGGMSTGLIKACRDLGYKLDLVAVNHWDVAIATHKQNYPQARHLCESLDRVDPRKVIPSGRLDVLVASPECTHHSIARGGKPCSDQSRASAWHILRWAEALRINNILIENVKEFQSWGPLGVNGRPLVTRKGDTYWAFLVALESLGYNVDARVINAADYGDPTTRERLFIVARRGRRKVDWPEPTHTPEGGDGLSGKTRQWRSAREIIDWSIPGKSIFCRKYPLADNTMRRIIAGIRKFCGPEFEPFLVQLYGTGKVRSINRPMPTVTASGNHTALCQPFLVEYYGNGKAKSVDRPVSTLTTKERLGICEPFILGQQSCASPRSVDQPVPTIATAGAISLVQPQVGRQVLDIRFRMLNPRELARAMSFDDDYKFYGNQSEQVKQIGNAVPVETARALCKRLLMQK